MRAAIILVITLTAALAAGTPRLGAQNAVTVEMRDYAFEPHEWTVTGGAMVRWVNMDDSPHHVVTETNKTIDSGPIAPGKEFTFAFTQAGRFVYRCAIHPTMLGIITVQAP